MFAERPLAAQRGGLRLHRGEGAFCLVKIERRDEAGLDPALDQAEAVLAAGQRFVTEEISGFSSETNTLIRKY